MPEQKKLIQFKNIVKSFEDGQVVLKGVSLDIYENEFVTLLGPSGCGKTTLLRILGGFLQPTEGKVLFDGEDIVNVPPYKREINTVFQKYALFPHMNVYDNIAFGLTIKKEPKDVIAQKVMRMLRLVSLEDYADRNVTELSGGQQQRIAIARALVNEPSVLLLDEPLGALDLKLRKEMQQELKYIQQEAGITFTFVTHDQDEAMSICDDIVVMKDGIEMQKDHPQTMYDNPKNLFVAKFLGVPPINVFEGRIENHKVFLGDECVLESDKLDQDKKIYIAIRPEGFVPVCDDYKLTIDVDQIITQGRDKSLIAMHDKFLGEQIKVIIDSDIPVSVGKVSLSIRKNKIFLFDYESEERIYF